MLKKIPFFVNGWTSSIPMERSSTVIRDGVPNIQDEV
jgi:hypothetical protein